MKKYERLLFIINLLYSRHNLNAGDLARKCKVSRRTIYRDIMSLSEANIPVYYDNGYQLLRTFTLPPMMLSEREAILLNMSLTFSPLPAVKHFERDLEKLKAKINSRVMTNINRDEVRVDQVVRMKANLSVGSGIAESLGVKIEKSISENTVVAMYYIDIHGRSSRRRIRPYSMIFRGRAFYLLAWCEKRKEFRLFRLERIKKYEITKDVFKRDGSFSIDRLFQYSWGVAGGDPHNIKIRFSSYIAYMFLSGKRHSTEIVNKLEDSSIEYQVRASGLDEMARWLVGFGGEAEVVYPAELAEKVLNLAKAACNKYNEDVPIKGCHKQAH